MSFPLEGPLPQVDLVGGATLTIEAVDPTTGATVAGVTFSDGFVWADDITPHGIAIDPAPPFLANLGH